MVASAPTILDELHEAGIIYTHANLPVKKSIGLLSRSYRILAI